MCYYYKDYFKTSFKSSYSFDKLKKQSNYFNQFSEVKEVFNEIYFNTKKGQEYLDGNENLEETIQFIIPLSSKKYPNLQFQLNKVKKEKNEILEEYKNVVNLYKNQIKIQNFNSRILAFRGKDIEIIKSWISPIENLYAKLLYSYYISYEIIDDFGVFYYKISIKDINKVGSVQLFHDKCDNKNNILMICKSGNQIFGGYTPLSFNSQNEYGKDNKSFLFSLNIKEKYPKNSFNNNESIWCYQQYGPSFHWDLYFRKNLINVVKFEKKHYLTPSNWVDKRNCFFDYNGIILDSLEIFKILSNNQSEEDKLDINVISEIENELINNTNNNNNNININNNNINNNNIININKSEKDYII